MSMCISLNRLSMQIAYLPKTFDSSTGWKDHVIVCYCNILIMIIPNINGILHVIHINFHVKLEPTLNSNIVLISTLSNQLYKLNINFRSSQTHIHKIPNRIFEKVAVKKITWIAPSEHRSQNVRLFWTWESKCQPLLNMGVEISTPSEHGTVEMSAPSEHGTVEMSVPFEYGSLNVIFI